MTEPPNIARIALQIAIRELGTEEAPHGSNRGPRVDEYIRAVGLSPEGNYPWCAAFVCFCVREAARTLNLPAPIPMMAGVLNLWWKIKPEQRITDAALAEPGMIFCMKFAGGTGHCGFVERVNGDATIHTIEGNTNDEGSREGYEVARRTRKASAINLGYIKLIVPVAAILPVGAPTT